MKRILVIGLAVSLIANAAHGQTTVPPNRLTIQADTGNDRNARDLGAIHAPKAPLDDLKAALRDLVVAEETYFSSHNGYTTDGRALDIFPTAHGQATTTVTFAGPNSWSGTATEPSLKGKSCVVFVGPVKELPKGAPKTLSGVVAKEEGVPVCDDP